MRFSSVKYLSRSVDPEPLRERSGLRWTGGTARGFGRFLQDQLNPHSRLFGDETRGLFYSPQHVARGTEVAMTLGWHVGSLDGNRFFYKEGGGGGFHSMMRVYPSRSVASVVMANATAFDVAKCLTAMDPQVLRPS